MVTGVATGSATGHAVFGLARTEDDQPGLAIRMLQIPSAADGVGHEVELVSLQGFAPDVGRYPISADGEFRATYRQVRLDGRSGKFMADSGRLHIVNSSPSGLEGTFEFRADGWHTFAYPRSQGRITAFGSFLADRVPNVYDISNSDPFPRIDATPPGIPIFPGDLDPRLEEPFLAALIDTMIARVTHPMLLDMLATFDVPASAVDPVESLLFACFPLDTFTKLVTFTESGTPAMRNAVQRSVGRYVAASAGMSPAAGVELAIARFHEYASAAYDETGFMLKTESDYPLRVYDRLIGGTVENHAIPLALLHHFLGTCEAWGFGATMREMFDLFISVGEEEWRRQIEMGLP